jgi:hypothetical protein
MLHAMDLYKEARAFPHSLRGRAKLLTAELIDRVGVSATATRWHTNKDRLVRVCRGVYLLGEEPPDLLDRARAMLVGCPKGTAVGFNTAAALHGFGVPQDAAIHVVVPKDCIIPRRRGLRVHESALPFAAVRTLGVPCTPAARTAIDLARSLDRATALAVLDAALFAGACSADGLGREAARHARLPGARQARALVPLADGRAECKQETHLRLILHDAGLRGFVPQVEVFDPESTFTHADFRLDLADRAHLVAAEYDGVSHTRGRLRSDRKRHNRLSELGWVMRYFTDDDLYRNPDGIVATLRKALAQQPNSMTMQ